MNTLNKEELEAIEFQLAEVDSFMKEDDFQLSFYESLKEQFETKKWLSDKQRASLDRIHERVTA